MDHIVRTPQQLASILKGWRTRRKLTQHDVAAKVGIKQSTVSVIEKDASHAEVDTLYKLLSALGVEPVEKKAQTKQELRDRYRHPLTSAVQYEADLSRSSTF